MLGEVCGSRILSIDEVGNFPIFLGSESVMHKTLSLVLLASALVVSCKGFTTFFTILQKKSNL